MAEAEQPPERAAPNTPEQNASDQELASDSQRDRLQLSTKIFVGAVLGAGCGVFFGEYCSPLSVVGELFVGLLRMTVLPFIAVSLIAGLGKLTKSSSGRLAWIGGAALIVIWTSTLLLVALLPRSFPVWKAGSLYSSLLPDESRPMDVLDYFVPSNVFYSLANNHVPAIILFCIFAGIALSGISTRQAVLQLLNTLSETLMRISISITRLAPIGVFAIAASTTGTISLSELNRLQAYLVTYSVGAVFLAFIVLPLLVTTITPLSYRQIFSVVKEPMFTAFVTGKLIIVLPLLIRNTEQLLATPGVLSRRSASDEHGGDIPAVEALYGTAYPFPHAGKLLSILFIPFAAWFLGRPLSPDEYPLFLGGGTLAYFGGPVVAIPFLLDQMQLPHDMFQLFLLSGVAGERIGDAVGAMSLCVLTLISIFGFHSSLRFHLWEILKYLCLVTALAGILLLGVRITLTHFIASAADRHQVIDRITLMTQPIEHRVIREGTPNPDPRLPGESLLERIRRRGVLRVGFNHDKLPFAFFNNHHELVGYDVEMAHTLARDLGVTLEFVHFDRDTLVEQLRNDHFDVVMSGLVGTLERAQAMLHTEGYLDVNLALATRDFRAAEFKELQAIREMDDLRVGFVDISRVFVNRLRSSLPDATLVEIENNEEFFRGKHPDLDVLLISAESGSAFTVFYPDYEIVIPDNVRVRLPLFYAIGNRDGEFRDFLEYWMSLKRKDGTSQEYFDHWVLGKTGNGKPPRWSVIRDVLHWVD